MEDKIKEITEAKANIDKVFEHKSRFNEEQQAEIDKATKSLCDAMAELSKVLPSFLNIKK